MQCSVHPHIVIGAGTVGDYHALKGFHYRAGHPGAVKRVFTARYFGPGVSSHEKGGMLAGVVVESLPALACALRQLSLPGVFDVKDRSLNAAKLNRDLRTISRVIVHPIFRSAGVAVQLVRHVLANAETPYVEALAAMGRIHPFFKRAGMREFDRPPLPAQVRLTAALAHEGMTALDLVGARVPAVSGFLRKEMERFTRLPAGTPVEELVSRAGATLLSQPLYYVWTSGTFLMEGERMKTPKVTQIPLERLHPHPKNSNVMAARTMKKLARHIEKTGRYEPLVVRPHPTIKGGFELINGHHRAKILKTLGHKEAACIVWKLDDAETLLLLATINRLGGEDAPGKRLGLLETLKESLRKSAAEMAALLPEEEEVLAKLLAGEVPAEMKFVPAAPLAEMPEMFMVFLTAGEKKELVAALGRTHADPALAIMEWARKV